ncbi:hypothetical protein BG846_03696 [Streptomyces fradiae ATCC 10745 = DSM 40063]|uniref:Uncharacterized protein n=1 Tax=Streptomyces fradiae ATCC 10745 = DSM 40063 TaxID=1319510 RepID=A0A1Y2NT28_STRFR|nr:hypothetical protein BG846_03696 [Streptomyces fradiae ATCC 10745 = DSM 40063]
MPPKPKPLTAARRTGASGQGRAVSGRWKGLSARLRRGFGDSTATAGTVPSRSDTMIFASPASPEAEWRWPIRRLTEPSATELRGTPWRPKTSVRARTSMGSPMAVPVPCASTYCTVAGSTVRYTLSSRSIWASRLGVVTPMVRPSLLTATPLIAPRTRSPSRSAAAIGFSTRAAAPSPGT